MYQPPRDSTIPINPAEHIMEIVATRGIEACNEKLAKALGDTPEFWYTLFKDWERYQQDKNRKPEPIVTSYDDGKGGFRVPSPSKTRR